MKYQLVIAFGALVFLGSVSFFGVQFYNFYHTKNTFNSVEVVATEKNVLGASTEENTINNCKTTTDFITDVERLRPYLYVYVGTDQVEFPISAVHTCVRFQEKAVNQYACPRIQADVNKKCIEELVQYKIEKETAVENIGSNRYNVQVKSRIRDGVLDYGLLAEKIETAYLSSITFNQILSDTATIKPVVVQAPMDNTKPNTSGNFATKYIEVDGSRQLIFTWKNGKYKTYHMSGAFYEYHPVGVYKILNKSPNAWSSTALKWMPYWMAFTADTKQMSMLGFHSLVYWYPGYSRTGESKIWEPESNIGTPRSTGCLRLKLDEAKELYYWANVGDWVIIHH